MKILIINSRLYPDDISGPQRVSYEFISYLDRQIGTEVHVLSERGSADYSKHYSTARLHLIEPVNGGGFWAFCLYQWRFLQAFRSIQSDFDIIHFQNFPGGKLFLTAYAAKKRCKRLLLTVHDWPLLELKYKRGLFQRLQHFVHWVLSRWALRFFEAFLVFSKFNQKRLRELVAQPIICLPLGLDDSYIRRLRRVRARSNKTVLYFGVLEEKKGVLCLIEAFSRLARDSGWRLILAGNGSQRSRLDAYVSQHQLSDRVQFLGYVSEREKLRLMDSCGVVVFPSEYEGFGIAILEALLAGKKVLTSDVGGQTEFVQDFSNLYLFKSKNALDLAAKLREIVSKKTCGLPDRVIDKYSQSSALKRIVKRLYYENSTGQ